MTQTTPATCVLGPGKTGLTIGLRVLNLDGTVYAAFSAVGVAETSTAGTYRKAGGVVAPLAGGYIVWGTALVDYAEATVESAAVNVTTWEGGVLPTIPAASDIATAVGAQTAETYTWQQVLAALDYMITRGFGGVRNWSLSSMMELSGANLDTLKTLSDQLDAIDPLNAQETADAVSKLAPTAGAPAAGSVGKHLDDILEDTSTTLPALIAVVDANVDAIKLVTDTLDVTAVTQVAASSAGHLTITASRTFDEAVTGLLIPADWVAAIWTLKRSASEADSAALVQLRTTNPPAGTDGLQRLLGAALVAPMTAADGTLTVTQASGRIDVLLSDELTALLSRATGLGWDVKFIDADGDSSGRRGTADVVLTETLAVV